MILNMDSYDRPIFRPWDPQESAEKTASETYLHATSSAKIQETVNSETRTMPHILYPDRIAIPSTTQIGDSGSYPMNIDDPSKTLLKTNHPVNHLMAQHINQIQYLPESFKSPQSLRSMPGQLGTPTSLLSNISYNNIMLQQIINEKLKKVDQQKKQRPKKFQCPHCRVSFTNNGQLKGHIRIHTGERPFKCDYPNCEKTFTRNEELTRHKRIHTGLKPFSCPMCCKCFGRKDHLKKHTRTHQRLLSMPTTMLPAPTAPLLHRPSPNSCFQLSYYQTPFF